jgi:hypothetical protein
MYELLSRGRAAVSAFDVLNQPKSERVKQALVKATPTEKTTIEGYDHDARRLEARLAGITDDQTRRKLEKDLVVAREGLDLTVRTIEQRVGVEAITPRTVKDLFGIEAQRNGIRDAQEITEGELMFAAPQVAAQVKTMENEIAGMKKERAMTIPDARGDEQEFQDQVRDKEDAMYELLSQGRTAVEVFDILMRPKSTAVTKTLAAATETEKATIESYAQDV